MLLLIICEHFSKLLFLPLLHLCLLLIHHDLLLDFLLLRAYLLINVLLYAPAARLLLLYLLIHQLSLLFDLLRQSFILSLQHRILLCNFPALSLLELFSVLTYLLLDLRKMLFKVRYNLLPLLFLTVNDPLVILLKRLVLVLILSR